MNTKTTLAVVLIAAALGVYFLAFESGRPPKPRGRQAQQQQDQAGTALFAQNKPSADGVTAIRLRWADRPETVIEQTDGGWKQTAPVRFTVTSYKAEDIVSKAADLRYTTTITPSASDLTLKQMGLDPAQAVVRLKRKSGEPVELHLGETTGAGRGYLTSGKPSKNGKVYIVEDALHEQVLETDPKSLRQKQLASINAGSARLVRIERGDQVLELRKRNDRWALSQPVSGRADTGSVESLINALSGASISEFVADQPENLSAYGLDEPTATVTIETVESSDDGSGNGSQQSGDGGQDQRGSDQSGNGKKSNKQSDEPKVTTHKLTIGAPEGLDEDKYFAMPGDTPVVFTIQSSTLESLSKKPNDLRDPSLTPVAKSDVQSIRVDRPGGQTLHVKRESGDWMFGEPAPGFALDAGRAENLLSAISEAEADSFVDLDKAEPGKAAASVTMSVVARTQPEKLAVHEHKKGKLLVVRGGESTGYVVPRSDLSQLFKPLLAYRDRDVLDVAERKITKLHMVRSGQYPAEYTLKRKSPSKSSDQEDQGGSSETSNSDQAPPPWNYAGLDKQAVRKVLDGLTPLRADEWLAEEPATTPEGVNITLTLSGGETRRVRIHPDSRTATASHVDKAFKVSSDLVGAVQAELRDRLVLELNTEQIAKVETGELTIRRGQDGRYTVTRGELKEDLAAAMFDALAGLSAAHYVDASRASGEPETTFTITTAGGTTETLKLWTPKEGEPVARHGEKVFTLGEKTVKKLTGKPVEDDSSGGPGAGRPGPGGRRGGLPPGIGGGRGGGGSGAQQLPPSIRRRLQQRARQQSGN